VTRVVAAGLAMSTMFVVASAAAAQDHQTSRAAMVGWLAALGTVWVLSTAQRAFVTIAAEDAAAPASRQPAALDDARERIRDLVTVESHLGRWVDEHGINYGTDAALSAKLALTRVQHAVRDMQECTAHIESRQARLRAGVAQ
jgi:hypothetical protein